MSEFRAALDLDHRYCSLCAEWAKPGRGKPVLIMRIGFFACFHAISLETQSFQQNRHVIFHVLITSTAFSPITCLLPSTLWKPSKCYTMVITLHGDKSPLDSSLQHKLETRPVSAVIPSSVL